MPKANKVAAEEAVVVAAVGDEAGVVAVAVAEADEVAVVVVEEATSSRSISSVIFSPRELPVVMVTIVNSFMAFKWRIGSRRTTGL